MIDEMIITIIVFSFSATFGIIAAFFTLFIIYAAVKRLITVVQSAIYHLLNGR